MCDSVCHWGNPKKPYLPQVSPPSASPSVGPRAAPPLPATRRKLL